MRKVLRYGTLCLIAALLLPLLSGGILAADPAEVTRAAWISQLVDTFSMTVDDTTAMPDNYYSDLTEDMPCYEDILLAVEFGVIDLEAGQPFRPDDPATREFAAHTLNFCLGFQPGDAETSIGDSQVLTYPEDVQIALARGWLAPVNGNFLPEQPLTAAEAETMLQDARQVLEETAAGIGGENSYSFAAGVIVIPADTEVQWEEGGFLTLRGYTGTLAVGDIFGISVEGYPIAYRAEAVEAQSDGSLRVETSFEGTEDAIASISYAGSLEADLASFEAAGETTYYITDTSEDGQGQVQLLSIEPRDIHYDSKTKTLTASLNLKVDHASAGSISVVLRNCALEHEEDFGFLSVDYCRAILTADAEVTSAITFDFGDYAGLPSSLTIGRVDLLFGLCSIELMVDYDISGGLSLNWEGDLRAGFCYDGNFRLIKSFEKKSFSFTAEMHVRTGLSVVANINLVIAKGSIGISAGAAMEVRMDYYETGVPTSCVDMKGYLYLDGYVSAEIKFVKSWSKSFEVYNSHNSPVRVSYHYEDNILVTHCTKGSASQYYTDPSSYYFNPSPGYGQSYSDGEGNIVQLYAYEVKQDSLLQEYAVITGYHGTASALAIPSEIDGFEVREIGNSAFKNQGTIRAVVIPDSVIQIGEYAFENCSSLCNVTLSHNLNTLGEYAFGSCTSLTEIQIPKSLISAPVDSFFPKGPFEGSGLTTVTFENGTTSVPANLFRGANKLKNVSLLETMTSIGINAFNSCSALEKITIPDSVMKIDENAFNACDALKEVTLSQNLQELYQGAFAECTSLQKIYIPKSLQTVRVDSFFPVGPFANSGISDVTFEPGMTSVPSNLFRGATALNTISLLDTMTVLGTSVFDGCTKLQAVTMPNSIQTIGEYAFAGCTTLQEVQLSSNLTNLYANAFSGCISLEEITIPKSLCNVIVDSFFPEGPFEESGLKKVTFEPGTSSVLPNLFRGAAYLSDVTLVDTITSIGASAFEGCSSLEQIHLPDSISYISSYAFISCEKLTSIIIPERVTKIEKGTFSSCVALEEISLPSTLTSIGDDAFSNCTSLKMVHFPNSITNIGNSAFSGSGLTSILLPSQCLSLGKNSFQNCDSLSSVILSNALQQIGDRTFYDCDVLEEIVLPDSVQSIGANCFQHCDLLKTVILGEGILKIPNYAFYECPMLISINLPKHVSSIGSYAFANCIALSSITIPRNTVAIEVSAFSYKDRLTIYGVPGTYAETFANTNGFAFVGQEYPAQSVAVSPTTLTMIRGTTHQLQITVSPENYTDAVSWKSTDTSVVTVSDAGLLTAKAVGTATVKVTVGNVSASCKVTVAQPVTSIRLNKTSATLEALDTLQLTATVSPSDAYQKAITWKSSDPSVAAVDDDGLVTAYQKGAATITASATDGSGKTATCKISVSNNAHIAYTASQLESPHPYANSCTDVWVLTAENATYMEVTFDARTALEEDFDFVYVYGGQDQPDNSHKYTGTALAGQTIRIAGDTVKIKLDTDDSGTEWGFLVTELRTDGTLNQFGALAAALEAAAALPTDQEKLNAVQALDQALLAQALADPESGIAEQLWRLEKSLEQQPEVTVDASLAAWFTAEDVTLTGAALNASDASAPVSVTLSSGTVGVLEEGRYANAKGLSLQIANAASPLAVPVLVELPIPNEIPAEALVVLQRQSDGTLRSIPVQVDALGATQRFSFIAQEAGEYLVVQVRNDMTGASIEGATAQLRVFSEEADAKVICAAYDDTGKLVYSGLHTIVVNHTWQTMEFTGIPTEALTLRFFLLDRNSGPVIGCLQSKR